MMWNRKQVQPTKPSMPETNSPRPWSFGLFGILDANNNYVIGHSPNSRLIVRAVNSLVEQETKPAAD